MKRLLLLLLLSLIFLQTRAQQVLYSQDFNYHYQVNFANPWLVTGSDGFFTWTCDVDYQIEGYLFPATDNTTRVAGINGAPSDSSARLITPPFSLSNVSAVFLKYKSFFKRDSVNGHVESAIIEATADNGLTWTVLGNAPVTPGTIYTGSVLNLSPLAGNPSVRLGFRYNDGGQGMTGWLIDDLVAYAPAQNDLALIDAQPSDSMLAYGMQNDAIPITGKVMNAGLQPVTAYTVNYKIGTGAVVSQTFSGLNLQALDTASFALAQPAIIPGVGRLPLKVWVTSANDANHSNDSATLKIFGAAFIPKKIVAVEEGTGTWFPGAPQQHVLMDALPATDYPVTLISLHDADPLWDSAYVKYIDHFRGSTYIPYFFFDRRLTVLPDHYLIVVDTTFNPPVVHAYGQFNVNAYLATFDKYRQYFGYANLILQPYISNGILTMNVAVNPAIDLHGDYRLVLALTENKVQHAGPGYEQANLFAGGAHSIMGGYESLPDPVPAAAMKYNYVARAAAPSAEGIAGVLPLNMTAGNAYNAALNAAISNQWIQGNMVANVLLINNADSTIINSASVPLPPLAVTDLTNAKLSAMVYPNPASTSANLLYLMNSGEEAEITIEDMQGKLVQHIYKKAGTTGMQNTVIYTKGWVAGIYVINLRTIKGAQSLKLTVLPE